jgi:hypothetical protein
MVSFGDSKHEPVKPLQNLLDVTPLKLALSAKCTIHDVVCWALFIVRLLSIFYSLLNPLNRSSDVSEKISFRVGKKMLVDRQDLLQFLVV